MTDSITVPDHIVNASHYRWYQRNQATILEKQKSYYEANKERLKANRRARYARQKALRQAERASNTSETNSAS